ncbi:copper chaperone PCu(A)C [Hoeflea sp. TYP-13]|uniref:copper chaperone PCu(A)C n=1 Tax=Hoeflea sp. TYP-13 TaxID=3230023 RepID=UPI0034C60B36
MRISKTLLAAAVIGVAALSANSANADSHDKHDMKAEVVMVGDIHLSGQWTRAMLPGQKVGGGFVTITNKGGEDDRLVAVKTPTTDRAEIHEMAIVDDVMKMRPLADGLPVPAGETVKLKPGSFHLMFMAVEEPFKEGAMVPVVLTFEKAGDVELMLPVMPAGTKAMDHGKMNHGPKTN